MADDLTDVTNMMREKINVVINTVKNKKIEKSERNKKIIDVISPVFDFDRMVKLSLGKRHWIQLTPEKRKEFTNVFLERIKESYLDKLDLYTDEKVEIKDAKKVKNRIYVLTYLLMKGEKKEMLYKFYKTKNGWKVYDIEVLGVSIIQTYRSQFNSALKNGTMDDLIKKLKNPS